MDTEADAEPPLARGLFLCDVLIQDARTKKVSLINLFDRVRATEFPTVPKPFVVYAHLTNGSGDVELAVHVESLDGMEHVYAQFSHARFPDPVGGLHVSFNVTTCSFPAPGEYQVVLYADRSPVAQTRLSVIEEE